jgi:hypothetical protein
MADFDPVGTIAFFRERHRVESATTGRVLRAMSAKMLAFRPHPASSPAGVAAWTIVRCLRLCQELTISDTSEVSSESPPGYEDLLHAFETEVHLLAASLLPLNQQDWQLERRVTAGGRVLLQQPLGQIFWLFHVDAIHHRGQISTYLRGFGAKVPSIYGPSGDSPA